MTCPCCKFLRVAKEAIKHPSLTSIATVKQVGAALHEAGPETIEALALCPTHGRVEVLDRFWVEYDRLVAEINTASRARVMKVLFRRSR